MTEKSRLSRTMRIDLAHDEVDPYSVPSRREIRMVRRADETTVEQVLGGASFQAILQTVYDGTLIAGLDGIILDVNPRAEYLFASGRDLLIGQPAATLFAGADEGLIDQIHEGLEERRHVLIQAYAEAADGNAFPAEVAVNQLTLDGEAYLCFFVRDITRRKEVQQRLRVERTAVHNAGAGIAMADTDGVITYVNPAFVRMWRCEGHRAALGHEFRDLFVDPKCADAIVQAVLTGKTWEAEVEARRFDGRSFYVVVSATANEDEDRALIGVVFSFMDVDSRRRAEKELALYRSELETLVAERTAELSKINKQLEQEVRDRRKAQKEIQDAEQYLETIIHTSHDGIMVIDNKGDFEFANEAAVEILGWPRDEVLGAHFITMIAPDYHDFMLERWEEVQRGEGAPYEVDIVTREGERRALAVSHRHMTVYDERRYCVVIKDITERSRMEHDLRSAVIRLEEHNREKTEFVSNVSHELRTPLTSMSYAADNLLSGVLGELPEAVRDYLSMIQQDCSRLTRTVHDILDLSRLEAGRLRLHRSRLPAGRLVRRNAEALRIQCREKQQVLRIDPGSDDAFVDGDEGKLERAVLNVIQNAIKYTPQGGEIDVFIVSEGGFVDVTVRDNGVGIEEEHLERVMERYYRVGEQAVGTGLGLALCKEIVELHGGRLDMTSPPPGYERGTQATIRLPAAPPPVVAVMGEVGELTNRVIEAISGAGYRVDPLDVDGSPGRAIVAAGADAVIMDLATCAEDVLKLLAEVRGNEELEAVHFVGIGSPDSSAVPVELLHAFHVPIIDRDAVDTACVAAVEAAIFGA